LRHVTCYLGRMECLIREMSAADRAAWSEMRAALWPEDTPEAHAGAIDRLLGKGGAWGFVAEALDGAALGFAEIAIRDYANGCESAPVPFLEGIWVKAQFRRRGVGARLIGHAETFLNKLGFREIGSDTHIGNFTSQAAHVAWGFSETERVVYFRKRLGG
jgi:aminoglycoside 6'-N-acetyltransferase I